MFEEFRGATIIARFFMISIRHRENSNGNKMTEVTIIESDDN